MVRLRELQAGFARYVMQAGPSAATPPEVIPGGRLRVYAEMYYHRLLDVLAEQHEGLRAQLGPEDFAVLVEEYLRMCPPRSYDVGRAGDRLPAFLQSWAGSGPWLADLARRERARVELFDAADAEPLARETVAALGPDELPELRLELIPAHALLESSWAILELDGGKRARAGRTRILVHRPELDVVHRAVGDDEWGALGLAARGCTLA